MKELKKFSINFSIEDGSVEIDNIEELCLVGEEEREDERETDTLNAMKIELERLQNELTRLQSLRD